MADVGANVQREGEGEDAAGHWLLFLLLVTLFCWLFVGVRLSSRGRELSFVSVDKDGR